MNQHPQKGAHMQNAELALTQEWDKTFPQSEHVSHSKVTFHNRYGITLAADLYKPKDAPADTKLAAIAVCGPSTEEASKALEASSALGRKE